MMKFVSNPPANARASSRRDQATSTETGAGSPVRKGPSPARAAVQATPEAAASSSSAPSGRWFGPVPARRPPEGGQNGLRLHRAVWDGHGQQVLRLVQKKGE